MKIAVFGGDGYCCWPAALHLSEVSEAGHEAVIADSLVRDSLLDVAIRHQDLVDRDLSMPKVQWRPAAREAASGSTNGSANGKVGAGVRAER